MEEVAWSVAVPPNTTICTSKSANDSGNIYGLICSYSTRNKDLHRPVNKLSKCLRQCVTDNADFKAVQSTALHFACHGTALVAQSGSYRHVLIPQKQTNVAQATCVALLEPTLIDR